MVYDEIMTVYTVKQLARHAGVSVRTLHHYDAIGLLKPARCRNGYRQYGQAEVLRLQQILFFRELGFSLDEIRDILSRPDFDPLEALEEHRALLQKRSERLHTLLETVDRTIDTLRGNRDMEIREYYEGFTDEQAEAYRREARERYGEKAVDESEQRVLKMGKERFAALGAEGERIFRDMADNLDKDPGSDAVQALVGEWRNWLEHFHHYSDEAVLGLARTYREDERFAAYYEKIRPGLADFITKAVESYYSSERG